MQDILPLRGFVQHYEWGGYHLIPDLLASPNTNGQPFAELWLGAHPKGPAEVWLDGQWLPFNKLPAEQMAQLLGPDVSTRFGGMPYLFKVLDVRKMLSIQVHPTLAQAEKGFQEEEQAGIPVDATHRNYRDRNHKPESMVALTDFWLLHGFRSLLEIETTLNDNPGWESLRPVFRQGGLAALYAHVMRAPQTEIDALLHPLYEHLLHASELPRTSPHYWARHAFNDYTFEGHYDRGIFSVYWFNLVYLRPGEGIFQAAGLPHAYLEGANMELMANSDNVLRGGLTPKYIDAEELLDKVVMEPIVPQRLLGDPIAEHIRRYPAPIPDYTFDRIVLPADQHQQLSLAGPGICFVYQGAVEVNGLVFGRGQSFVAAAGTQLNLRATSEQAADLYCASCD